VQNLAAAVVDPSPVFVAVGETSEPFALDMDGNCGREVLFGWFMNTYFCVISHTRNVIRKCCRLQVTDDGVFPYPTWGHKSHLNVTPSVLSLNMHLLKTGNAKKNSCGR
jgi:hypothetical protein